MSFDLVVGMVWGFFLGIIITRKIEDGERLVAKSEGKVK